MTIYLRGLTAISRLLRRGQVNDYLAVTSRNTPSFYVPFIVFIFVHLHRETSNNFPIDWFSFIYIDLFVYGIQLRLVFVKKWRVLRFLWKIIRRKRNFSPKLKKKIFDSKGINKFHKIILSKFPLSRYLFFFLFASCSTESTNRLILYILSSPQIWNLATSQRIVFPKLLPGLPANYENHRWQICQRVTSHREKSLFGKEQLGNRDKHTDPTSYEFNIRTT